MIRDVFARATIVARLETGPLSRQLKSFATALIKRCYAKPTIREYLRNADLFGRWLTKQDVPLDQVNDKVIECYLRELSGRSKLFTRKQQSKVTTPIRALQRHLQETGAISDAPPHASPVTETGLCLIRYAEHLEKVAGLALTTRKKYLYFASRLLSAHCQSGTMDWSILTADKITEFVQHDAASRKGFGPHGTATSIRSFLRFLVSQGLLPAGVELAIPSVKRWSQAALPQRLSEVELERLLTISAANTAMSKRNYAVLLLLSRLGLRAKEVARLQLEDVDWVNGSLLVKAGKTHCERTLPLPQDVGEALLSYLQAGRPATRHRNFFLEHTAPFLPLRTASAITKIVKRSMAKTGIERRSSGAHLLRHTTATQMVNRGASFKDVADVLGHQSLQTTAIYAKLDLAALSKVALPWPGGEQ